MAGDSSSLHPSLRGCTNEGLGFRVWGLGSSLHPSLRGCTYVCSSWSYLRPTLGTPCFKYAARPAHMSNTQPPTGPAWKCIHLCFFCTHLLVCSPSFAIPVCREHTGILPASQRCARPIRPPDQTQSHQYLYSVQRTPLHAPLLTNWTQASTRSKIRSSAPLTLPNGRQVDLRMEHHRQLLLTGSGLPSTILVPPFKGGKRRFELTAPAPCLLSASLPALLFFCLSLSLFSFSCVFAHVCLRVACIQHAHVIPA